MRAIGIGIGTAFTGGAQFSPANLFLASEAGAWYDPSDLSSMFQDSAGTAPAVVGQPVGLLLDKRLGLAMGPDLVPNGSFGSSTDWTLPAETTISGGTLNFAATTATRTATTPASIAANARYRVTYTVASFTAGGVYVTIGGAQTSQRVAPGTYTEDVTTNVTASALGMRAIIGTTASVDVLSIQEVKGNHAVQATTASRPVLRQDAGGKYYLEFDGVDDRLDTLMSVPQPFDRISGLHQIGWTSGDIVFGSLVGDYGTLYQSAVTPRLRLYSGAAGPNSIPVDQPAIGLTAVVSERFNGASSLLTLNNGTAATGDPGAAATSSFHMGARGAGTAAGNFRMYGMMMIGRGLSDNEAQQARRFMAAKSGVTL